MSRIGEASNHRCSIVCNMSEGYTSSESAPSNPAAASAYHSDDEEEDPPLTSMSPAQQSPHRGVPGEKRGNLGNTSAPLLSSPIRALVHDNDRIGARRGN